LPIRNRSSTSGEVIAWRPGAASAISYRHAQQYDCHPPVEASFNRREAATPDVMGLAVVPFWDYYSAMRVIALRTIKHFVDSKPKYSDAREPALAWYRQVLRADWASPAEVKRDIGSASILKDGRVVFNIGGNKYRIVVWINYPYRIVYVRFIGTHSEYDRIDAQTV
jgi:mRNA interferase HigB